MTKDVLVSVRGAQIADGETNNLRLSRQAAIISKMASIISSMMRYWRARKEASAIPSKLMRTASI
mgnify:CR=1 FL=1